MSELYDFDGSAVMIHAQPDNFANVPERYLEDETEPDEDTLATGDAGERLGCGVVESVVEE
jgi:Cu-Zn family superoxide dismutase